jgi:hypothetical protein
VLGGTGVCVEVVCDIGAVGELMTEDPIPEPVEGDTGRWTSGGPDRCGGSSGHLLDHHRPLGVTPTTMLS